MPKVLPLKLSIYSNFSLQPRVPKDKNQLKYQDFLVSSTTIPFQNLKAHPTFREHIYTELSLNVFAGAATSKKQNLSRWKNINYFVDHITPEYYERLKTEPIADPGRSNMKAKDQSKLLPSKIAECLALAKELLAEEQQNQQEEVGEPVEQPAEEPADEQQNQAKAKKKSTAQAMQKRALQVEGSGAGAGSSKDAPLVQVAKRYRVDDYPPLLPEIGAKTLASLPRKLNIAEDHHSLPFAAVMVTPTEVLERLTGNAVAVKEEIAKINRQSKLNMIELQIIIDDFNFQRKAS